MGRPAFESLTIEGWRQFESVDIRFHPRFTVLTGANASGKTTLLGVLARHFDWRRQYSAELSTDRKSRRKWRNLRRRLDREYEQGHLGDIGTLTYGTQVTTPIRVPSGASDIRSDYELDMPSQQPVDGVYLTSHRLVSGNYVKVTDIPTTFTDADTLFKEFTKEVRRTSLNTAATGRSQSPQLAFKRAIIAAAIFGNPGNEYVESNPIARDIWHGYLAILHEVMPATVGFLSIRVRMPDVIIETRTGDFIMDDASGGISAVMEVAWQIFLRSRTKDRFTVMIDEPENHLHPSLQREIMPSLLRAFPGVQFIVATHSPFVVTSTADSAVYALELNESHRVVSRELDYANKAASADETLRNVLGVSSTVPKWAEHVFEEIINRYSHQPLNEKIIRDLREELRRNGLAGEFPEAIVRTTDDDRPGAW